MTDTCGVCNRPLLDPESRAAGIGPTCAKKFHGSTATAGSHQLTFEEPMTDQPKTPAVWTDSDPLMEATASAVWEQCTTEGPSTVVDDPRTIAAVAATVARRLLGADPEQAMTGVDRAALERVRSYLAARLDQVAVDPAEVYNVLTGAAQHTGRCGTDPRTVLSPGDQAAVTQFKEYLARRRRVFSAVTENEPETEEQRADREETERAHEAGDHEHCGPTCEAEFPTEMLRNTILYAALPGSGTMLEELLRRATGEAGHDAERYKADHLASCKTIAEMYEAATGRKGMGPIRGVVEDVADVRSRADEAEKERDGLRRALHLLRYGMTRAKGNDFAADYVVTLIDETVAQCTGTVMEPCDADEQRARADQAEAAIKRTVHQMRAYVVASGCAGVNPQQVIGLLSTTWPDGNYEAPALGSVEATS
ncbi:DUF6011 domain-containing protein [Streptomyces griseobrunneus]